jgi:hypothetical protein
MMILSLKLAACLIAIAATASAEEAVADHKFNVKPFKIDLSGEIPRLKSLVKNTRLPSAALYPDAGQEKGVELDFLRELQTEWLTDYDWEAQQAKLNQFLWISLFTYIYLTLVRA